MFQKISQVKSYFQTTICGATNIANTLTETQHGAEKSSTAVDSLANEDSLIGPEISNESNIDENQLNSTQPASISGESEIVDGMKTPCHQMRPIDEAEKSTNVQDENMTTSFEKMNSLRVSLFEPNENSTPKPSNEVESEGKLHRTPCKTGKTNELKRKSSESSAVLNPIVSFYFSQIPKHLHHKTIYVYVILFSKTNSTVQAL